jgi:hypothetical protein
MIVGIVTPENEAACLETALRVPPRRVAFCTPTEVVALFGALDAHVGLEAGAQFDDHADFTQDGFRCTVPACTARRNLQSHHVHFRSAGETDVAWNRTTLCACHHHRGVHPTPWSTHSAWGGSGRGT